MQDKWKPWSPNADDMVWSDIKVETQPFVHLKCSKGGHYIGITHNMCIQGVILKPLLTYCLFFKMLENVIFFSMWKNKSLMHVNFQWIVPFKKTLVEHMCYGYIFFSDPPRVLAWCAFLLQFWNMCTKARLKILIMNRK